LGGNLLLGATDPYHGGNGHRQNNQSTGILHFLSFLLWFLLYRVAAGVTILSGQDFAPALV
jgi:hypothetical protein